MALTVTIFLDDDTLIDAGVPMDLLSGGTRVATVLTDGFGSVTFDVDPSTLGSAAIRVNPNPPVAT